MDAAEKIRVLWAGSTTHPSRVVPGRCRVECRRSVGAALGAITEAAETGSPFAACFLAWGEHGFGVQELNDLLRVSPNLFLVLEGDARHLPSPRELGPWVSPERCLTLAYPIHPAVRQSLADHLGARWHREATERKRISVLEAESRTHQAHRQRDEDRLRVLYGIVEKLHENGRLDGALGVALGEMSRFLGARTGSLLVLEGSERLRVLEAVGPNRSRILGIEIPLEKSRISRYALEERQPILVEDMQDNERFRESQDGIRFRARSVLSVPLFNNGAPVGVLNFGADAQNASFTEQDRELVITLGRQVAVALEQGRLLNGLREAVEESIRALAGAIEAKDPYTRGHSDRVTHYSRLIAEAMGLDQHELDVIVRAAILHDVGKIGVPEAVLNKPGRLTDEEFLLIRRHPVVGVEIVREIQAMEETLDIIRAHHERVDGKGYPTGIRGDDIPLGARIMAVVDTYDAMTSDRPYRQGLPAEVALEEIERCSSTQFDPEVAKIFLKGSSEWPDLVSPLSEAAEA